MPSVKRTNLGKKRTYKRTKSQPRRTPAPTSGSWVNPKYWLPGTGGMAPGSSYYIKRTVIFGTDQNGPLGIWMKTNGQGIGIGTEQADQTTLLINNAANNCALYFALNGMTIQQGNVPVNNVPMPNVTDLTNLFQQYKITYVELTFNFSVNAFQYPDGRSSDGQNMPILLLAIDTDDAATATPSDLLQYDRLVQWQPNSNNSQKKISFRPRAKNVFYTGTNVSAGVSSDSDWFSTANSDLPFYGIKIAAMNTGYPLSSLETEPGLLGCITVCAKYHMVFKDLK